MKGDGGSRETARAMYLEIAENSDDKQAREVAEIRLMQLDSLEERDAIRNSLQKFKEKNSRCANSLTEILPLLQTVKLPNGKDFRIDQSKNLVDPTGAPYLLDKAICDVVLDSKTSKIPMK